MRRWDSICKISISLGATLLAICVGCTLLLARKWSSVGLVWLDEMQIVTSLDRTYMTHLRDICRYADSQVPENGHNPTCSTEDC